MNSTVFRVLLHAQPIAGQAGPMVADHATLSVAVQAPDSATAEQQALALLPLLGWRPLGSAIRVSNLTQLLRDSAQESFDSGFGDYARQWLQVIHDEALTEGSSPHLLSVDYEYLNEPRRLNPLS